MSARLPLVLVAFCLLLLPAAATAAVPELDPAFNDGQPRRLDYGGPGTYLEDALVDGSGRIVVEGKGDAPVIGRLLANGAIDPAFGTAGAVRTGSACGPLSARGLFQDPNGRLGTAFQLPPGCSGTSVLQAVRYADNGAEDASYADNGRASVETGVAGDAGYFLIRALPGPAGATTLVMMGSGSDASRGRMRVIRLDADGRLNPTYGTGGRATIDLPLRATMPNADYIENAVAYPDGRVLAVGRTLDPLGRQAMLVTRVTAAGTADTTFSGDGSAVIQPAAGANGNSEATAAALAPNGSIYIAGATQPDVAANAPQAVLLRLTAAGAVDTTFAVSRLPGPAFGLTGYYAYAVGVVVQGDLKPLLVASLPTDEPNVTASALGLARFLADGRLDTTFGTGGTFNGRYGRSTNPRRAALSGSSRLVVVGDGISGNESQQGLERGFVVRYLIRENDVKAPENVTPPGLTGTPRPGQTLTCSAATWRNSPTTIAVAWDRAPRATSSPTDPAWLPIAGATARTYVVRTEDNGARVRCREVATNGDGSASAPSSSLRVDAGVPAVLRRPALSGVPIVGRTLACDTGEWSNNPDLTIAWERSGSPIAGATQRSYTLVPSDRRTNVRCVVSAANDLGPAAAPEATLAVLVVGAVPVNTRKPEATGASVGPKPTDFRVTCVSAGQWDEHDGGYEYRWLRDGAEIAGATGPFYDATIDDLGRTVACQVFATNAVGRSEGAASDGVLVPLPAVTTAKTGRIVAVPGFNELSPTNMVAFSGDYLDAIDELVLARTTSALQARRDACASSREPLPDRAAAFRHPDRPLSFDSVCGVLNNRPVENVLVSLEGIYWWEDDCEVPDHHETFGPSTRCPRLRIDVAPLDPARAPVLSAAEQARLAPVTPKTVLWDFNADGRLDASCDATAPILRSVFSNGNYHARAVIVDATSGETGRVSVADYDLSFFPDSADQLGALRPAQPFACRTTLDEPVTEARPCLEEATIGRIHIEGNLCPISSRQIPQQELREGSIPEDVKAFWRAIAEGQSGVERRTAPLATERIGGLPAGHGSLEFATATQVSALSTLPSAAPLRVKPGVRALMRAIPSVRDRPVQLAMDEIYIAKGAAKVNGILVDPIGTAAMVLVPSDVTNTISSVKAMTLSVSKTDTSLGTLPIGDPDKLAAQLTDQIDVAPPTLRSVDLDPGAISDKVKSKLDAALGPFKLRGDTKLRLADDGSAFIDASAELPGLLGGPGGSPIRTDVTVRADRDGNIRLEGLHLNVGQAYLGAIKVKDLDLVYNREEGLNVRGQLLFPPLDQGISIEEFKLGPDGRFRSLVAAYKTGSGPGIPLGAGIFMTRLQGGLRLQPVEEITGGASFAVGPPTGGGCPTVGVNADFTVHFAPAPFYVDAKGEVVLVCIPIVKTHFYADSTGLVKLTADINLKAGPIYFDAKMFGGVKLPRWQISMSAMGGVRPIIEGNLTAVIGNLGMAACGGVRVFFIPVPVQVGGGVRFVNGRPPLTFSELIDNVEVFTGCDLSEWSPFGQVRAAGDGSARTFKVAAPAPDMLALQVYGDGGAPQVRLRAPDGSVIDATGLSADTFTNTRELAGLAEPARSRVDVFVPGQAGTWTIEPAEGSPAIVEVRHAEVLPKPKVTASVGGAGASRQLEYSVAPIEGQQVRFVEQSRQGQRVIKTVKKGGSGTVGFTTSEGRGTARTIVAEVVQDDLPRANLTVARFRAPSPAPTRPTRVRIRRQGTRGVVTWARSAYATRYEVVVSTGDGTRELFSPGKRRRVRFSGLGAKEAASASVVAISPAGYRSPAGRGRAIRR